jgi:hypothetical protein
MHISGEGKLGLLAALIGIGTAGAVWVAPAFTEIGWSMIAGAIVGMIALAAHHFWPTLTNLRQLTRKGKILAFFGILSFCIGFVGVTIYILRTIEERGPDVAMRLVYPTRPALMLDNKSHYTAQSIKYAFALLYINGKNAGTPVPILSAGADFIKSNDSVGPENLFDPPQIVRTPTEGEKMFGWMQINCLNCVRIRYYWAYIQFGFGGWYVEVPKKRFEDIVRWLKNSGKHDASDSDINEILSVIPRRDRTQIQTP